MDFRVTRLPPQKSKDLKTIQQHKMFCLTAVLLLSLRTTNHAILLLVVLDCHTRQMGIGTVKAGTAHAAAACLLLILTAPDDSSVVLPIPSAASSSVVLLLQRSWGPQPTGQTFLSIMDSHVKPLSVSVQTEAGPHGLPYGLAHFIVGTAASAVLEELRLRLRLILLVVVRQEEEWVLFRPRQRRRSRQESASSASCSSSLLK